MEKGETLVVLGASGSTGIAAIQIGKIIGAKVIAVASNSKKQKIAKENGADLSIGYDNLKEKLKEKLGDDKVGEMFCLGYCYENHAFHYDGQNYAGNFPHPHCMSEWVYLPWFIAFRPSRLASVVRPSRHSDNLHLVHNYFTT